MSKKDMTLRAGEVLIHELVARGEDPTAFAIKIGMFPSDFIDLLNSRQPITASIAEKLEQQLNMPASFWLQLQADQDEQSH